MSNIYELIYSLETGEVESVLRNGANTIPISDGNTDFQEFLKWNAEQETPLDLDSTVVRPINHSISPGAVTVFAGQAVTFTITTDPALSSVDIEVYDRDDRLNTLTITTVELVDGLGTIEVTTSEETAGSVMVVTGVAGSTLENVIAYIKVE
jgi:hypothetical protein